MRWLKFRQSLGWEHEALITGGGDSGTDEVLHESKIDVFNLGDRFSDKVRGEHGGGGSRDSTAFSVEG